MLVLGLFGSAVWFWTFFILLALVKSALLLQYYRYGKAWQQLREAKEHAAQEEEPVDEEVVCRCMEKLQSLERPAIELHISPSPGAATGSSKWGGQPDVPSDFQWPVDDDQRPLSHLLQINCADLAAHDPEGLLPSGGQWSFPVVRKQSCHCRMEESD